MTPAWNHKDLCALGDHTPDELLTILDTATAFKGVGERNLKKVPALRGKTLVNFFVEPSTRTRISFELAALRLSADVVNIAANASSLEKGRPCSTRPATWRPFGPDLIVIRHKSAGSARFLAQRLGACGDQCRGRCPRAPDAGPARRLHDQGETGPHPGVRVAIVGDILFQPRRPAPISTY